MSLLNKTLVKAAAEGHWRQIFISLAPVLSEAIEKADLNPSNHVPCPIHGKGKDGFRLFPQWEETGAAICNTCGAFGDGFQLLMKLNRWSFPQALEKVAEVLGLKNGSRVLATETEGSTFSGTVAFAGMSKMKNGQSCFLVRFAEGSRHWGKDLERAVKEAGIKPGDKAQIVLIAKQTIRNSKGQVYTRTVWGATRLLSDEEEKRLSEETKAEAEKRKEALREVFRASKVFDFQNDTPASRYLINRGINAETSTLKGAEFGTDIRTIDALAYRHDDETFSRHPAILCLVKDKDGQFVTFHRIYLSEDGKKADVPEPKKLMHGLPGTTVKGAAVRLGPQCEGILCVAEGIETSLSVISATGYPCWATISASGMAAVEIPENVHTVFIFADKDRSEVGQKAAFKLKERLCNEGKTAVVLLPSEEISEGSKGVDWNDVLASKGKDAFPVRKAVKLTSSPA